jgi:3-phosphoshikimate 1-carboxyvinyltransferase
VIEETANLNGEVNAPPSKSYTHRAIIATSLAAGVSRINFPLYANDTHATINACISFGVKLKQQKTALDVSGLCKLKAPLNTIDCADSASTIRFLTPIGALADGQSVFTGSSGLRRRPMSPLLEALRELGVLCKSNQGYPPITVVGNTLSGGRTSLRGDISSQFVTGLLFACPLAKKNSEIILTTPLESKPYVKLTLDILENQGVETSVSDNFQRYNIAGNQRYLPKDHRVPGDFSAAAFLLAAAAMTNSDVTINNLTINQPDSEIITLLNKMGTSIKIIKNAITVSSRKLKGITINARDIPDLVPVCAALACVSEGTTQILNAKRLRLKESDRLTALSTELRKMEADINERREGLIIQGSNSLRGALINPHSDHRVAMACAIAGLRAKGKTEIREAECVNKSYPDFYKDLQRLGARIHVN